MVLSPEPVSSTSQGRTWKEIEVGQYCSLEQNTGSSSWIPGGWSVMADEAEHPPPFRVVLRNKPRTVVALAETLGDARADWLLVSELAYASRFATPDEVPQSPEDDTADDGAGPAAPAGSGPVAAVGSFFGGLGSSVVGLIPKGGAAKDGSGGTAAGKTGKDKSAGKDKAAATGSGKNKASNKPPPNTDPVWQRLTSFCQAEGERQARARAAGKAAGASARGLDDVDLKVAVEMSADEAAAAAAAGPAIPVDGSVEPSVALSAREGETAAPSLFDAAADSLIAVIDENAAQQPRRAGTPKPQAVEAAPYTREEAAAIAVLAARAVAAASVPRDHPFEREFAIHTAAALEVPYSVVERHRLVINDISGRPAATPLIKPLALPEDDTLVGLGDVELVELASGDDSVPADQIAVVSAMAGGTPTPGESGTGGTDTSAVLGVALGSDGSQSGSENGSGSGGNNATGDDGDGGDSSSSSNSDNSGSHSGSSGSDDSHTTSNNNKSGSGEGSGDGSDSAEENESSPAAKSKSKSKDKNKGKGPVRELAASEPASGELSTELVPDPPTTPLPMASEFDPLEEDEFTQRTHPVIGAYIRIAKARPGVAERALVVLLLACCTEGTYDSRSRAALRELSAMLELDYHLLQAAEDAFLIVLQRNEREIAATEEQLDETKSSGRAWKIGAAAVGGGALLLVTGGLAAPFIGAAVGTAAAMAGAGTTAATIATVTTVGAQYGLTVGGAAFAGYSMEKRTTGLSDLSIQHGGGDGLHVTIAIPGFLYEQHDILADWRDWHDTLQTGSHFVLKWETERLIALGTMLKKYVTDTIRGQIAGEIIKRSIFAPLALPMSMISQIGSINHPWTACADKAKKAGKVLADMLNEGAHGNRPVSLVGFGFGARVIGSCLERLEELGRYDIVDTVVMIGAAIPSWDVEAWGTYRRVAAGRLINAYNSGDWVLGIVYRAVHASLSVAGVHPIEGVPGVENIDVANLEGIGQILSYKSSVQAVLEHVQFPN